MKVESTTDYGKFKTLWGNRVVDPGHVRKLISSLGSRSLLQHNPVLVNEDFCVIDGQHRLAAAKHLGIPVYYTVVPDSNLETIRSLNANLRAWSLRDFCESYVKLGNEDYVTLLEFVDDHEIPITTAAQLLCGKRSDNSDLSKTIRDGLFVVTNLQNGKAIMDQIKQLEPFTEAKVWHSREFLRAYIVFCQKGGQIERLVDKLRRHIDYKIRKEADYRRYLLVLQDIYNSHAKDRLEII